MPYMQVIGALTLRGVGIVRKVMRTVMKRKGMAMRMVRVRMRMVMN